MKKSGYRNNFWIQGVFIANEKSGVMFFLSQYPKKGRSDFFRPTAEIIGADIDYPYGKHALKFFSYPSLASCEYSCISS